MTILVTGAAGQLGRCLLEIMQADDVIAADRQALDISDPAQVSVRLNQWQPDVIINCAAYTAVDLAEQNSEAAFTVNARGPEYLAQWCVQNGARLIHISTDYVFPGNQPHPWKTSDTPMPLSVYGKSKLAGEIAIRDSGCRHTIIRAGWLFSRHGHNFVSAMIKAAQQKPELRVVSDQTGTPVPAMALARLIVTLIENNDAPSLLHMGGYPAVNRADYAREIIALACKYQLLSHTVPVIDCASSDFADSAPRPVNSALELSEGLPACDWRDGLREMFQALRS